MLILALLKLGSGKDGRNEVQACFQECSAKLVLIPKSFARRRGMLIF